MSEKKQPIFKTPDLSKMQEVVMDDRTCIYIPLGANPEKARIRYWERIEAKGKMYVKAKKV